MYTGIYLYYSLLVYLPILVQIYLFIYLSSNWFMVFINGLQVVCIDHTLFISLFPSLSACLT